MHFNNCLTLASKYLFCYLIGSLVKTDTDINVKKNSAKLKNKKKLSIKYGGARQMTFHQSVSEVRFVACISQFDGLTTTDLIYRKKCN